MESSRDVLQRASEVGTDLRAVRHRDSRRQFGSALCWRRSSSPSNTLSRKGQISERSGSADVALSEKSPYLGGAWVRRSLWKVAGMFSKEPLR